MVENDIQVGIREERETPLDNSWEYALQKQNEDRQREQEAEYLAQQRQEVANNARIYQGFRSMGDEYRNAVMQRRNAAAGTLVSAMKYAGANGGQLPEYTLDTLNRAMGNDGETKAVFGAGFDKKGNFLMRVAQKNPQTGQLSDGVYKLSPMEQYQLAMSVPGVYSREEMGALASDLTSKYGYRPDEVPQIPQGWGGETGGTAGGVTIPTLTRRRSSISAFGANGRGGFTDYYSGEDTGYPLAQRDSGTRSVDNKGEWRQVSVGPSEDAEIEHDELVTDENGNPVLNENGEKVTRHVKGNRSQVRRYENTKTGEVVSVKDGETPPWERRVESDKAKIEQMRQDGMNRRADMRQRQTDQKYDLQQKQLYAKIQQQIASAKNAEERNAILKADKAARVKQFEEELDRKYAQMGIQYGTGETRKAAQAKVGEKLAEKPSDKAEVKQGDNGRHERTAQEIRANPQNGDELPLKGGGKARYNGKTGKWEKVQ